ncbi:exodeoxyribonuclease VII small subunit [Parelusimicrobium proximum]|uniref:exodeoxyribonuclease VII small subunit n=1 Tax=Parelusimicrobium proximum TaxID=3228953 RepID=UPI003D175573
MPAKEAGFESKLKKLEEIVEELEDEKTDLDKSVKLFEEGSALAAELSKQLKEIKFKVSQLKEKQGELFTEEFDEA